MESNYRVAELLIRLMNGEALSFKKFADKFSVSTRTFQRDISYIRSALAECDAGKIEKTADDTYRLAQKSEQKNFEMVLATSHILLGSRALKQDELSDTLTFLSSGLPPAMQAELHQQLTIPRGSYVPLSTPKPLLKQLREMTMYIANNQKLVFMYHSSAPGQDYPIKHRAQPVAITFQTHYFYVVMLSEQHGGYWLYRLDRVVKILEAKKGDKLDYAERFSLQDYHHQTYLEDNGTLTRIQFIYRNYKGTALDALPDAHVLKEYADGSLLIEAYVKVGGAMFWLMSQGPGLKVVSPPSLVKRIRDELTAARDQYLE